MIKKFVLSMTVSAMILGCGGSKGSGVDEYAFLDGDEYYQTYPAASYYGYEKMEIKDNMVTQKGYVVENGVFIEDPSYPFVLYYISDGEWKDVRSGSDSNISADKKSLFMVESKVNIKKVNVENISAKNVKFAEDNGTVTMPDGAKRITFKSSFDSSKIDETSKTRYNYFLIEKKGYTTFSQLIKDKCGEKDIFGREDYSKSYAFTCGQENDTNGTLVGKTVDGNQPLAGVWNIREVEDTNIEILEVSLNDKYNVDKDEPTTIFSIIDSAVWVGEYSKQEDVIMELNSTYYNKIAIEAIKAKMLELSK